MRRLFQVLLFLSLLLAHSESAVAGTPWRVDSGLIPDASVERLQARYADIKDADELEALLRDIGRRHPTLRLDAYFENNMWVVEGLKAPLVVDIELTMVSRFLRTPLAAAVQNYVGQVDSPEIQAKVKDVVSKYLRKRGYPGTKVKIETEKQDDGIAYKVAINEGNPCIIERIELGFKLPSGASLDARPGDICDREELETALSELELELRDRGYNQVKIELADVTYDMEHDTAIVFVSGILGQRVRYEIVDASKRFLIDDLFEDQELTKVDPTIVGPDAMAAELARRYRSRGFSDVVIRGPDVRKAGEDEFVYVFNVSPGRQYVLKSVQFEGVTVFKESELLDIMGLESLWQTQRPLNLEEIQTGLDALKARYLAAGYWDVKVRDPGGGQKDKETGTVRVTIQVDEGLPRVLDKITIAGNNALPTGEIEAMLYTMPGNPLDRGKLVDFQQDIRTAYLSKGHLYAEVQLEIKPTENKRRIDIELIVKINEETRVRIGDITIVGLIRTDQKVVRRELLFKSGDWWDPDKITATRIALTRLGLFRSVQIVPADRNAIVEKQRDVDLLIDVREGKAGNVSFGPGWSLLRGWNYEAEASYSNIGGVGRQASVRGSISEERQQQPIGSKTLLGRKIGAGYLEPWILDYPVDAAISANQKAEANGALWELSYGGEVALIHKLRVFLPGSTVSPFYGQKVVKIEGTTESEDELIAKDVRIGALGVRYNLDRRDNLKFPTGGYTLDTEFAWARYGLGGDLRYFKWDVSTSTYVGLRDDLVLAFGINLTSYEGIERRGENLAGILPPSERLPVGGSESVRGYRPGSLGPAVRSPSFHDDGAGNCDVSYKTEPLNGNRRTVVKTELRYKITESLAVTGFVDNGVSFFSQDQMDKFAKEYADPVQSTGACAGANAYRSVEDNIGYEYRDLVQNPGFILSRHYFSYGTSLNILTALGSINFGYGLPWKEPESERCKADHGLCNPRGKQGGFWLQRGEFHLNVGARF